MNDHPERALTPAQDAAPRGRSRRRDAARTTGTTGRPTMRTEALVREVITLVATGTTVKDAAQQVGVDPVTLWRWRQRDPVLAARAAFLTRQVERIDEAAEKDWKAAAWLLERSEPSSWEKRVEVQVEGPGRAVVDPLTGMVIEPGMDVMALPSLGACKREVSEGSAGRDMHD